MRRLILLLTIASLLAGTAAAQNGRARRAETKPAGAGNAAFTRLPFAPGETLSYDVAWNGSVSAARLEMRVAERGQFSGQEGIRLEADLRTIGLVRTIGGAVDAHFVSYADPRTVLPFRVERQTTVNGKATQENVTFDRQAKTATPDGGAPLAVDAETGDVLSLFYRIRALPLKVGYSATLDGVERGRRLSVKATVEAKENITTTAGTYKALRVVFLPVQAGQPNETGKTTVWYSDDDARLPVLITAEPKIGPIRIALTKVARS